MTAVYCGERGEVKNLTVMNRLSPVGEREDGTTDGGDARLLTRLVAVHWFRRAVQLDKRAGVYTCHAIV